MKKQNKGTKKKGRVIALVIGIMLILLLGLWLRYGPYVLEQRAIGREYSYEIDRAAGEVALRRYIGDSKSLTVPSHIWGYPVTRLDGTFSASHLTDIILPETIRYIGKETFRLNDFTEIKLPDSLEYIGEDAFLGCVYLKEIVIPDDVTTLGRFSFLFCYSL